LIQIKKRNTSEIFLERARARQPKMPLGLLVKDGATTKISIGMLILCSVQNFGYYGLMIWLPSYLSTRFGYSLTQSALWTAVTVLGMAIGILIFGHFADRVGRRAALYTFQAGAFIMVLVYSQLISPAALLIGGAVMGLFVKGMLGGYGALLAELIRPKLGPPPQTSFSISGVVSAASARLSSASWRRLIPSRWRSDCWRASI
jgi:MFS family permease